MPKNSYFLIGLLLLISSAGIAQQSDLRKKVRQTYTSQIGVREATGRNDGAEVETYLKYVWLKKGNPWCASFVSWCFGQSGIRSARSGGCVALMQQGKIIFQKLRQIQVPQSADVFFIWFPNKGRVAHTGFIDKWDESFVHTVEGNTNEAGSREGDGVYRKKRLKRQIYAVASYIN